MSLVGPPTLCMSRGVGTKKFFLFAQRLEGQEAKGRISLEGQGHSMYFEYIQICANNNCDYEAEEKAQHLLLPLCLQGCLHTQKYVADMGAAPHQAPKHHQHAGTSDDWRAYPGVLDQEAG